MQWYLEVLKKYAVFSGRARRQEYWMFVLFNLIVTIVLAVIDAIIGWPAVLRLLYSLAVLLPALGVSVRRLHDTDRSGWWLLISLVPIVGFIVLLVYTVQEGASGRNRYGDNPKAEAVG